MAREQISPAVAERRCPNCGTRVAQDAESCFMCGHDLRIRRRRRQRISIVDALLVLAVLAVLALWWRIANQPRQQPVQDAQQVILPTNIPLLTETVTSTVTSAGEAEPTVTPTPDSVVRPDGVIRHRVRPGETLVGIAEIYGVTVEEIQAANSLEDVLIRDGDELIIPVTNSAEQESSPGVASQFEYQVQSGDTIVSIASTFGSSIQDIILVNGLSDSAVIRPGDVLLIPVAEVPPEVLLSSEEAEPATATDDDTPDSSLATDAETIYIAPRLVGPPDEATIPRDEPVLLRWVSVDVLEPNEWYVLLLYPVSGDAGSIPSLWTKATSYRLEGDLAPPEGGEATYAWQVSVVRVMPGEDNQYALEAASPPSELRNFTWR